MIISDCNSQFWFNVHDRGLVLWSFHTFLEKQSLKAAPFTFLHIASAELDPINSDFKQILFFWTTISVYNSQFWFNVHDRGLLLWSFHTFLEKQSVKAAPFMFLHIAYL